MSTRRKKHVRSNVKIRETDSTYLLKLVLVIILGSFWLRLHQPLVINDAVFLALPVGGILGAFLVYRYEKSQDDRKIWYALLVITTMLSYMLPTGIVI